MEHLDKLREYLGYVHTALVTYGNKDLVIEGMLSNVEKSLKEVNELRKIQNYINASIPPKAKEEPCKEMVDHPAHYQGLTVDGKNVECIEAMEQLKGWFRTAAFCELNAFKYNWRMGEKDSVPQEAGKMAWYGSKAKELWENAFHWFYPKNCHKYAIIDIGRIKMKNPSTKEWQEAYLYTDGEGLYVRDTKDFNDKFEFFNNYKGEKK